VYVCVAIMIRFNFFIEPDLIDKLKKEKGKFGFTSVASFIRFIIIKFFDKNI
jgi:hypothetical protein